MKILLVDDHTPTREHVEVLLRNETDMNVVAAVGSAEEALEADSRLLPDIVVMDIMLPEMNGIEAIRRILSVRPDARILVLSNHSGTVLMQAVMEAGGLGYVSKNRANEELIPAIRAIAADES